VRVQPVLPAPPDAAAPADDANHGGGGQH
jgi:hypothetical protein